MKASEIVTNAFGGNLVRDFADKVKNDLYHIARIVNNCEIDTTTNELTSIDTDLLRFMEQNEIPLVEYKCSKRMIGILEFISTMKRLKTLIGKCLKKLKTSRR